MDNLRTLLEARWYLAAIFDGEGCIYHTTNGPRRVTIVNTDKDIIDAACEALDTLDIDYHLLVRPPGGSNQKDLYVVYITSRDNLVLFYEKVPFQSEAKRRKYEKILNSYQRIRTRVRTSG